MKYRNTSDQPQELPHKGIVQPGETIETTERIENKNFQLVEEHEVHNAPQPDLSNLEQ